MDLRILWGLIQELLEKYCSAIGVDVVVKDGAKAGK
ncbi:hypothetical protein SVI_3477 [Shewanella violacea DSS12]|uniref:Uncharacterized protein n=1 Tax=Shewanella violacea (strain JCM 10179 / CIP 106290 / LMG 19151 / DSS12) TaxID=637905 RepID=D4ZBQ3_SHEVD|nr:hypothetical protein SVI_3477 [Shewanella violacea DSS12]